MTPRQLFAYADFIYRERLARYSALLQIQTLAASGDDKAIRRQLKDWAKDI